MNRAGLPDRRWGRMGTGADRNADCNAWRSVFADLDDADIAPAVIAFDEPAFAIGSDVDRGGRGSGADNRACGKSGAYAPTPARVSLCIAAGRGESARDRQGGQRGSGDL